MANEPEAASAPESGKPAGKSRRFGPMLIIVALMGAEGIGVFFVTKFLSEPQTAHGQSPSSADGTPEDATITDLAEVALADCRPTNSRLGKPIAVHIRVSALVAASDRKTVEDMVKERQGRIDHAVNIVIRSVDPVHLDEPRLETVCRQLKHRLDKIFGDDRLIHSLLIPHLQKSSAGL